MFADRKEAGEALAQRLLCRADLAHAVILALPRGGVPVAAAVALTCHRPLDVLLVQKLGYPEAPEVAMGAIGACGVRVLNDDIDLQDANVAGRVAEVEQKERLELQRRQRRYRPNNEVHTLTDQVVWIIDDGVATGASMKAAVAVVQSHRPRAVVVAVPVCPPEVSVALQQCGAEVLALTVLAPFHAVGAHYRNFAQLTDDEVLFWLNRCRGSGDLSIK